MTRVLRTRAELRAALAGAPAGRPRAHDGLAPRGPPVADAARARRGRDDGRDHLRQPAPVQRAGRLSRYPRNEARDVAICEEEGVDLVWAPPVEEVYSPGFDTTVARGRHRRARSRAPRGPATSTAWPRWWPSCSALVGAEHAYFGQKDAQQVMVIRRMALRPRTADGRSSRVPRSAKPTASRSRRATCTSPLSSGRRRRSCIARCSRRATRGAAASGRPTRSARLMRASREPLARHRLRLGRRGVTLRGARARGGRRCCRWRSASGPPGSSTTSPSAETGVGLSRDCSYLPFMHERDARRNKTPSRRDGKTSIVVATISASATWRIDLAGASNGADSSPQPPTTTACCR